MAKPDLSALSEMTVPQLKTIAQSYDIEGTSKMKKDELVDALLVASAETETQPAGEGLIPDNLELAALQQRVAALEARVAAIDSRTAPMTQILGRTT